MGQRLNIEIKNSEGVLANAYYHWAGYTSSSLELTKQCIEFIKEKNPGNDLKAAIKVLEATGAAFGAPAWGNAVSEGLVKGAFKGCADRNSGLIGAAISDIKETRTWEEGRIEINIEDRTFDFKCAHENEYREDDEIWDKIKDLFHEIGEVSSCYRIPFNQVDVLAEGVSIAEKDFKGRFCFGYSSFSSIY